MNKIERAPFIVLSCIALKLQDTVIFFNNRYSGKITVTIKDYSKNKLDSDIFYIKFIMQLMKT